MSAYVRLALFAALAFAAGGCPRGQKAVPAEVEVDWPEDAGPVFDGGDAGDGGGSGTVDEAGGQLPAASPPQ